MLEDVTFKMRNDTLSQLDYIKNAVKAPSRSDAIRRTIDITNNLINAITQGNRILIESHDGSKKQLSISGMALCD